MGIKTYLPGLVLVLTAAHRYMSRYQTTISGNLTESQLACFTSSLEAITNCLIALGAIQQNP